MNCVEIFNYTNLNIDDNFNTVFNLEYIIGSITFISILVNGFFLFTLNKKIKDISYNLTPPLYTNNTNVRYSPFNNQTYNVRI